MSRPNEKLLSKNGSNDELTITLHVESLAACLDNTVTRQERKFVYSLTSWTMIPNPSYLAHTHTIFKKGLVLISLKYARSESVCLI
jgi:hypothetical protein